MDFHGIPWISMDFHGFPSSACGMGKYINHGMRSVFFGILEFGGYGPGLDDMAWVGVPFMGAIFDAA